MTEVVSASRKCAFIKKDGDRCGKWALKGKNCCKTHGGKSASLPIHGHYSKRIPVMLRNAYEESLNSPGLVDMREPLAILSAYVERLMERVDQLDTPGYRDCAKDIVLDYRDAMAEGDTDKAEGLIDALEDHLHRGADEDRAVREMIEGVEKFARQQEATWKVLTAASNSISKKDFALFVGWITSMIESVLPDKYAKLVLYELDRKFMEGGEIQP